MQELFAIHGPALLLQNNEHDRETAMNFKRLLQRIQQITDRA